MSNKNHKMVNGRLIKTDKSFANLKLSQKDKISDWLFEEYYSLFKSNGYNIVRILMMKFFQMFMKRSSLPRFGCRMENL